METTTSFTLPQASFSNLHKLLNSLTEVICIIDGEGRFVYLNQACYTIWGYQPEELIGKACFDMILEEDQAPSIEAWEKLLAGSPEFEFENHYYHKDGSLVTMVWIGRWDREDQLLYVSGRDITAKKRTEEKLQQLSLVAKETINAVSLATADGKIFWVNEAYTHITGYTAEEAIGQKNSELLFGPDSDQGVVHYMLECFAKGAPFQGEVLCYTKTKEKKWIEASGQPILNKEGGVEQYFIIQTDITERKRAEAELQKLSLVAKKTNNAVIFTDAAQQITWVNEAFTTITGYTKEEVMGKVPTDLLQGRQSDPAIAKYMKNQRLKGEGFVVEVKGTKKGGASYCMEISCQPVLDEEGRVQQFFSIGTDITGKKKLQEQLAKEKVEKQKSITSAVIKAQEQERAQVSLELHDNVNQVLTTVKLYTELCLKGLGHREDLLQKSIQLLQDSINAIRDLSKRLSSPSIGVIRLKDSITELIDAVVVTDQVAITLDVKGISTLEVSKEVHLAVYRILQEHLTNILKHACAKRVSICITKSNKKLILRVEDDGIGFNTKKKSKGIGITNMISRAEALKGTLTLISSEGKGCVLEAIIPLT